MSSSRFQSSGKPEVGGATIGFRFHANGEELEELQSEKEETEDKHDLNLDLKLKTAFSSSSDPLDNSKSEGDKVEGIGDSVKDHWNILGKRSISVDSNYESPFSHHSETWRRLSELKVKIAKTVEEKISEMKIDRNVLSKSSGDKLLSSKENSSISDSEDTSESSKLSEKWKDADDMSPSKLQEKSDSLSSILENTAENSKMEIESDESELRNRKSSKLSDLIKLPDIKIATAKSELDRDFEANLMEEVEHGVEADENLNPTDSNSIDMFEGSFLTSGENNPPPGSHTRTEFLKLCYSALFETDTVALLIGLGFYIFLPMSDFIKGFLFSYFLMAFWQKFKHYIQVDDSHLEQKVFVVPDYKNLPPLKVPVFKPPKGIWVNEYEKEVYNPDFYSVSHTIPAYLELENSTLKLSRPKGKIHKRATYDEPDYKLHFISQRIYNLSGCNVFLLPEGLTRKRLFSKKYPIVIFLKPDSLISETKKGKEVAEDRESPAASDTEDFSSVPDSPKNRSNLYIFARCDRQKEEWYRKLIAATKVNTTPTSKEMNTIPEENEEKESSEESTTKECSTPFENLYFDEDVTQTEEYLKYMAKFISTENNPIVGKAVKQHYSWYRKLKLKKKDCCAEDLDVESSRVTINSVPKKVKSSKISVTVEEKNHEETEHEEILNSSLQVQWFNAFINRILFDVFRSPYWIQKIHEKVEKKLNSIRLPYYIEDIEVIELDLGKTGPTFHRVSQPYIDERGLWFDMDVTFDGLIKLTIQTHLNLIKLQKGFEEDEEMAHSHDKPDKGKKKHKEAKESLPMKDSKEPSKENVDRKNTKSEDIIVPSTFDVQPSAVTFEAEEITSNLIDEVAQLAELAVTETFSSSESNVNPKETKNEVRTIETEPKKSRKKPRSPIYDSEVEDSAESSDEDDEEEEESPTSPLVPQEPEEQAHTSAAKRYPKSRRSSKKIFRVFENVAQSKYFKSVAQSKYIQKAIAGVSATKLRLTLEIKSCTGILTVNIPPPPSDRFWYGFREMPKLIFSANPKIGEKVLRFVHIQNYLQKKILHEIKKVMVLPNMIDFVLPTSSPIRSSSSLQIELPELDEQEQTPSE